MSKAIRVEQLNNLRVVVMDDGSRNLMLPTGTGLWLRSKALPGKSVINNLIPFLSGAAKAVWCVCLNNTLVLGWQFPGQSHIAYSTDNGVNWTQSTMPTVSDTSLQFVKVVNGKIYTSYGNVGVLVSSDNGHSFVIASTPGFVRGVDYDGERYITIGNMNTANAAESLDGINFTPYTATLNHLGGNSFNGSIGGTSPNGDLTYFQGTWYGWTDAHAHFPDIAIPQNTIFTSADAHTWAEESIDIGADPVYISHIGAPLIIIQDHLLSTPYYQGQPLAPSNGKFFTITGNVQRVETANDVVDVRHEFINESQGTFWIASDTDDVWSTVLKTWPSLDSFAPVFAFGETEYNTSAKVVNSDGILYVFEKEISGDQNTRLVKVTV